ncbi:hypothetical protein L9F63_000117, partial [Diploptera punctata]
LGVGIQVGGQWAPPNLCYWQELPVLLFWGARQAWGPLHGAAAVVGPPSLDGSTEARMWPSLGPLSCLPWLGLSPLGMTCQRSRSGNSSVAHLMPCTYGKKAVPKVCSFFSDVLECVRNSLRADLPITRHLRDPLHLLRTNNSEEDTKKQRLGNIERVEPSEIQKDLSDLGFQARLK